MKIVRILQLLSILILPLGAHAQPSKENQSAKGDPIENPLPKGRVTRGYVSVEQPRSDSQRVVRLPEKLTPIPERRIVPAQ